VAAERSGFTASLLSAGAPGRRYVLYKARIDAGATRTAEPHPTDTVEHVRVRAGRAEVGPDGATERLDPGDYYRYPGDVRHRYAALDGPARLLIVMEASG
jgi:quercetin dioxygenase-like cupin family protein